MRPGQTLPAELGQQQPPHDPGFAGPKCQVHTRKSNWAPGVGGWRLPGEVPEQEVVGGGGVGAGRAAREVKGEGKQAAWGGAGAVTASPSPCYSGFETTE